MHEEFANRRDGTLSLAVPIIHFTFFEIEIFNIESAETVSLPLQVMSMRDCKDTDSDTIQHT
jgi:hypothetical protein